MSRRDRKPLDFDPENYEPLFDSDFIDDATIQDDRDLADIIGDERMRRNGPFGEREE